MCHPSVFSEYNSEGINGDTLSFDDCYLLFCQAVESIDKSVDLLVRCGDLGGEVVAGGLILGKEVHPLVLLIEGEFDFLLFEFGNERTYMWYVINSRSICFVPLPHALCAFPILYVVQSLLHNFVRFDNCSQAIHAHEVVINGGNVINLRVTENLFIRRAGKQVVFRQ